MAVWSMFFISTIREAQKPDPVRQDSPEKILGYVRTVNSPLILINFWASWCEPCKEELPALVKLEQKYSGRGLKVILVSIDDQDETAAAEAYLRDHQIAFTAFYKGLQPLRFVSQIYPKWSGAVPATLLMDRNLKILDAWEGDTTLEEFEQRVAPFLKGKT